MAFESSVSLKTPGQKAEDKLMEMAGHSNVEAGGFRRRDDAAQSIHEGVSEMKRKRRRTNNAYKMAVKRGDARAAMAAIGMLDRMGGSGQGRDE